ARLSRSGPVRHPARATGCGRLRLRHPLVPRCGAGAPREPHRIRGAPPALPALPRRRRRAAPRPHDERRRVLARSGRDRRLMSYPDMLREHAADPASASRTFLRCAEARWTFAETLREASRYAHLFLERRDPGRPFHVGLLLENRPEFVLAELGAGLCGAVIVGLNPMRQGEPLARDIAHADCQIVLTEERFASQLADALATPGAPAPVVMIAETSLRDPPASQP